MDARLFEKAVGKALEDRLGLTLERFSVRREVSGAVDAVAFVRGIAPLHSIAASEPQSLFASVRTAGSRVTARLSDAALEEFAGGVERARAADVFAGDDLRSRRFLVDFCDPNATKPLHLGHLRNIAVGAGLARLLELAGAEVVTQAVLGDIGRNVAEAMAGVERFGDTVGTTEKVDHWVGACYARYLEASETQHIDSGSPDAPIARELDVKGDRADELLNAWLDGEAAVRDDWASLIAGVTSAQNNTLRRLSVSITRTLLESEGALMSREWLASAQNAGVVAKRGDGAVVFETGLDSYPALLLLRPDGVPTEHMRALPLWTRLQEEGDCYSRCFHVMGEEWLVTTELRESLVRKVTSAPLFDRYVKLAHGFVTIAGSKMKSSDGKALTVDAALDRLGREGEVNRLMTESSGAWDRDGIAAALMTSTLLSVPPHEGCEIEPDRFVTADAHRSALTLLGAVLELAGSRKSARFRPDDASDRYLLLQAARLPGFIDRATFSGDLCEFVRFVHRVAQQVLTRCPDSQAAVSAADWILAHGVRVLGLKPLHAV